MPRKASDKTITHRIELGIVERQKLEELLQLQKENQRIDGITATLQAGGAALGGGSLLWAALAVAAYLTPGLLEKSWNSTRNFVDELFSPIVDPVKDDLTKTLKDDVIAASKNYTTALNEVNLFCTPGANYDEAKCITAQNNLEAAIQQKREAQDNVSTVLNDPRQAAYDAVKDRYPFVGFIVEGSGLSRFYNLDT